MGEVTLYTCLSTMVHQSSGSPARPGAGRSAHQPIHHPGRQPGGTRTCRAVRTHQQQDAQCDQPHRGHERWGLHFNSSADTARRLRAGQATPPPSHPPHIAPPCCRSPTWLPLSTGSPPWVCVAHRRRLRQKRTAAKAKGLDCCNHQTHAPLPPAHARPPPPSHWCVTMVRSEVG